MNTRTHIILLSACVLALAITCLLSIGAPLRFEQERAQREQVVKQRLLRIRDAEQAYLQRNGTYTASLDKLTEQGLLPRQLHTIPFSGGQRFVLSASTQTSRTGKALPLVECAAPYSAYLKGMDASAIQELTRQANATGLFPGLKFGSMDTPGCTSGNWE